MKKNLIILTSNSTNTEAKVVCESRSREEWTGRGGGTVPVNKIEDWVKLLLLSLNSIPTLISYTTPLLMISLTPPSLNSNTQRIFFTFTESGHLILIGNHCHGGRTLSMLMMR